MPTSADGPEFHAVLLDILAGAPEAFLHPHDAGLLGVRPMERIRIHVVENEAEFPAVVNVSPTVVHQGCIGLSRELAARMRLPGDAKLRARPAPRPVSVEAIRRKLDGHELAGADIASVIHDIAGGHLTPVEITCWAAAVHTRGLSIDETVACVQAMVDTGERLSWNGATIYDVHSVGGVPGNKYAPIVVSIAAAAGLKVPKTSSRAISSACGTADFMEVLAPVAFDAGQLRNITETVGATLAWGGGVALAPADDEIIRVEYPLGIDPPAQIVASVLAKKVAMGVGKVLIDLPCGPGAKARDRKAADDMVDRFTQVGARLGLDVRCEVTSGSRPLGRAIGPILEAREMLATLESGTGPPDLIEKSCRLAGLLLEMAGKAVPGKGKEQALALLHSGAAHQKFLAIIAAQGGRASVRSQELVPGPHSFEAAAVLDSRFEFENRSIVTIARAAGSPQSKGAGVLLLAGIGEAVSSGQALFRVHAETAAHLANAWDATQRLAGFQCRALPPAQPIPG
jgi:AMP phosphorylase